MKVLEYAKECGNVAKACHYFGISRQCSPSANETPASGWWRIGCGLGTS